MAVLLKSPPKVRQWCVVDPSGDARVTVQMRGEREGGAPFVATCRVEIRFKGVNAADRAVDPVRAPGVLARAFWQEVTQYERRVARSSPRAPIPDTWECSAELTVVVLRGAEITIARAGPEEIEQSLAELLPVRVLRAQSTAQIPEPGEAFDRRIVLPVYDTTDMLYTEKDLEVEEDPGAPGRKGGRAAAPSPSLQRERRPAPLRSEADRKRHRARVTVRHIPNGVRFEWYWTHQVFEVRVDEGSVDSGFSYYVDAGRAVSGDSRPRHSDILHVRFTGNVRFATTRPTVTFDPLEPGPPVRGITNLDLMRFFRVERVEGLADLPVQGRPFRCESAELAVSLGELDPDLASRIAIDLLIGQIPVVGDLVDVGEFVYALRNRKDKWGDEVDSIDLALMGVGAVTPLLTSGGLRNLVRKLRAGG